MTEILTGIDIIRQQILMAETLDIPEERIHLVGKAIQVRANAEDPKNNFMPEGGKRVEVYQSPGASGNPSTASCTRATKFPPITIRCWSS